MKIMDHTHGRRMLSVLACLFAVAIATSAVAETPRAAGAPGAQKGAKAPPAKAKPSASKPAPPPAYGYPGGLIERHAKRLGLSEETVAAMRETIEKSRAENEKIRVRVESEQNQLRTLLDKDLPDEAAVMSQAEKIGALFVDQRKNQLRAMLKMRAMLTPEQRAELDKIRNEHPMRREGTGSPGHGRPGPPPGGGPPGPHHGKPKPPPPAD